MFYLILALNSGKNHRGHRRGAANGKLKGFAAADAVMTAPETRSSSPVRIVRDDTRQAKIRGLYPTGEGAGYAGGIMSAAIDGIMTAEAILGVSYER